VRFEGVNLGESAQDLSLTAMVDLQCTEVGVAIGGASSICNWSAMHVSRSFKRFGSTDLHQQYGESPEERTRTRIHPSIIGLPPSRLEISPWKHRAMRDTTRVQSGKKCKKSSELIAEMVGTFSQSAARRRIERLAYSDARALFPIVGRADASGASQPIR
jgi:hypothetical protein